MAERPTPREVIAAWLARSWGYKKVRESCLLAADAILADLADADYEIDPAGLFDDCAATVDRLWVQRNRAVQALAEIVFTLADTGGYPAARAQGDALLKEDWAKAVLFEGGRDG